MPYDPKPAKSGKYLDQKSWDSLKAAGFTDEELYADQPLGPVILAYTRKQAIEDGMLLDLTEPGFARLLKLCGIKHHTAMTAASFGACVGLDMTPKNAREITGRVLIVLAAMGTASSDETKEATDRVFFSVDGPDGQPVELWALCGPGDEGEPVITIMLREED